MFTGIVETIGIIEHIHPSQLTIRIPDFFDDLKIGDSIAVNGVCLTITQLHTHQLTVTAVPETLRCTNLNLLNIESPVNLERALLNNGRMGGHYVQGHVDAVCEIIEIKNDGPAAIIVTMTIPPSLDQYIVNKGYVTLDGMSITVIEAKNHIFTVTFIPHTRHATITQNYKVGTKINLEVDILSKYVEKFIGGSTHANSY